MKDIVVRIIKRILLWPIHIMNNRMMVGDLKEYISANPELRERKEGEKEWREYWKGLNSKKPSILSYRVFAKYLKMNMWGGGN